MFFYLFTHPYHSDDIKHMFQLISQYNPQKVDIETKLLPFIPEFIPAVGDIDAFIKIPRPDGIDDGVGLLGNGDN